MVGRAELLASLMYILAILSYAKSSSKKRQKSVQGYIRPTKWRHLLMTLGLAGLSMLSKEQGVTVLAVCAAYEIFVANKMVPSDFLTALRKQQVRQLTHLFLFLFVNLPGGQINDPTSVRILYSFVPSSNSLVLGSDPCEAFLGDLAAYKGPQPCHLFFFRN